MEVSKMEVTTAKFRPKYCTGERIYDVIDKDDLWEVICSDEQYAIIAIVKSRTLDGDLVYYGELRVLDQKDGKFCHAKSKMRIARPHKITGQ